MPNHPTPGKNVIATPHQPRMIWNPATHKTNKNKISAENRFHGIVINKSNGMKIRQLRPGISHKIISQGMPHGSHHVIKFNGNIVKMYWTFGVTWFLINGWQFDARFNSLALSSPNFTPNLALLFRI